MANHLRRAPWRPDPFSGTWHEVKWGTAMKFKACPAGYSVKTHATSAGVDSAAVEFEAIVSVFNNPDAGGDIVRPGAFADTIAAWKSSGDTLPVLWSHRMDDPHYNIGGVAEIEELSAGDERIPEWAHPWVKANGGLWVKAVLDDGPDASPIAKTVATLMRKRRVTQFSFAYDVLSERPTPDGKYNELLKLGLYEVGPTQIGMNELTELGDMKAAEVEQADPPEEPPQSEEDTTIERRPSPALLRLRCDIAAMEHAHTAD
jgi:phage head maturation protease